MIRKLSSLAKTVAAFQNFGCAILTTTVATIQMNQLSNADKEIARTDGKDVRVERTTGAYLNGCSATEKTIAATTATKSQKIVRSVRTPTSDVETTAAYPSKVFSFCWRYFRFNIGRTVRLSFISDDGFAIMKTIAQTIRMKPTLCARESTEIVQKVNSAVVTGSAYLKDGVAITMMIVVTIRMNPAALISNAK